MQLLASRLSRIQPSPTLALNARALELKLQGIDVINLAAGEPDFDTPAWIREAATQAMNQGLTKYTAVDGMLSLKQAVQKKFLRDNSLDYALDEINVSNGGKQVIFNALFATLESYNEVIIPAPYWVSYPDMVHLCGGISRIVPCGEDVGFKLTPRALEAAITPQTKWLILNSPSNPTGAVYSADELKALAAVLRPHPDIYVMSDDIYEHLIYDDLSFTNIVQVEPRLKFRTLIVNGVSKAYSMTGWRIGYGAGPAKLIKAMNLIQSQSTSNACSIAQAAAVMALNGPQDFLADWRQSFQDRRDMTLDGINKIEGLTCLRPGGAFYLYVNCAGVLGKTAPDGRPIETDNDFCGYLLDKAQVTAVSGDAFGLSPYFRISYAISKEKLTEACARIEKAVKALVS
ncbi:MAG: pyridoxal phosphate-dependent aminotransferase [Alphaproteobacteria bacterium]|nr:pyridoxal phosphate-dependent aminotransferase [Alphaproteobacteria bacterium]